VYFSLHGLTVDAVIVSGLLPNEISDAWFNEWHTSQDKILHAVVTGLDTFFVTSPNTEKHDVKL
jgi:hypothetical protein